MLFKQHPAACVGQPTLTQVGRWEQQGGPRGADRVYPIGACLGKLALAGALSLNIHS